MIKVRNYNLILSDDIKRNIIVDYVDNLFSLREIMQKYQICSKVFIVKLLGDKIRSNSEGNKIARQKYPEKFKHTEESKAKIRAIRLAYMKAHPEKTAWRKKNLSYPEQQFIKFLQEYGYDKKYHIERELSIFPFFIDFAFTDQKIAIEIDGSQHLLPERKAKDDEKDALLIEQGWKVIRFTENLVKTDWNTIHEILSNYLNDKNVSDSIVVGIFTKPKGYKRLTENGPTQKQLDAWYKQRKIIKEPIKEELEAKIGRIPMTEIAKDYGISDNALRKWCQKLGVKYRKLELNPNYTNIKVCPICGKEFKADEQSRKFCSKECVNKYNSKRPSDEELIIMFSSNKNIDELTKEYNVCKRTISTWKKYYKENILNK